MKKENPSTIHPSILHQIIVIISVIIRKQKTTVLLAAAFASAVSQNLMDVPLIYLLLVFQICVAVALLLFGSNNSATKSSGSDQVSSPPTRPDPVR